MINTTALAAPGENIQDFLSCLMTYENQTLGKELNQAKVSEEIEEAKNIPSLTASVNTQRDLQNNPNQIKNTNWTLGVSQNIYSNSLRHSLQAQSINTKAQTELTKNQLLSQSGEKLEILLLYISLIEERKAVKSQIERQEQMSKLLNALVKSRVTDGSQMLIVQSDLMQLNSRLAELETSFRYYESKLKVYSFFSEKNFLNSQSRSKFLTFAENLKPLEVEKQPQIKSLGLQTQVSTALLSAHENSWWPSLDANLQYMEALNNPESLSVTKEALVGLTLTLPMDSIYNTKALKSYDRAEIIRLSVAKERLQKDLKIEADNDEKILTDAKNSLKTLEESKNLLSKARQVMMKKFELNRVSYFEISSLDEKIDQITLAVIQKQIIVWRIYSRWALQKLAANGGNKCNLK